MTNKIIKFENLAKIRKKYKDKKIILSHGVFDLIHRGHVEYFKEAKSLGHILVVSVTIDKFVGKGFNRPYFTVGDRVNLLSELQIIDFVVISKEKSSIKIINALKPDFYVKGPDYKSVKNDKAGNYLDEKKAVEKNKGKIYLTSGKQYSSTKIINSKFEEYNYFEKFLNFNGISSIDKKNVINELEKNIKKIKKQKILVIGEIILDNYFYCTPLGTPSKENILSVNYINRKNFIGGIIPVVKNLMELSNNISFVSLYKNQTIKKKMNSIFRKKVKNHLIYEANYKEIKKNRFIDLKTSRKFFEYYEFNNSKFDNKNLLNFLKLNLKNYDKVVVCDFGHGMINNEIISTLEKKSKYLCLNVQTNSGNRGYNLFTKFKCADLLVLDEPEARLGLSMRYANFEKIIQNKKLKKFKNIMITRGINGLAVKLHKKSDYYLYPAIITHAIDTLGAGDAAYSYACALAGNTNNNFLIGFMSSISGGIKTKILGHSESIKFLEAKRTLESILK